MDPLLLSAFFFFALTATITPGPNNIMMMSSGARFGMRRTAPHILGVAFGFPAMVLASGLGLGALLQESPLLHKVLRLAGTGFMLWMAFAIAFAPPKNDAAQEENADKNKGLKAETDVTSKDRPMRFFEAVLFQWVNPKAWTMGIGAITTYTAPHSPFFPQLFTMVVIFTIVGIPSAIIWTAFGKGIRRFLGTPMRQRIFNVAMGLLLFISLIPTLSDALNIMKAAGP